VQLNILTGSYLSTIPISNSILGSITKKGLSCCGPLNLKEDDDFDDVYFQHMDYKEHFTRLAKEA
jgi:hypothetical protein